MERFWRRLMCVAAISVMILAMTPGVSAENTDCSHLYETLTEEATCTNPGVSYDECTLCGKTTNYANIPALGHSFGVWTVSKAASCTGTGVEVRQCEFCGYYEEQEVDALGHSYESSVLSPTCTKQGYTQYTCSVCGDSYKSDYVDALGHSYESSVLSPTCTKQGYTQYTCSVCADSCKTDYVDALGHAYVSSVVLPTCEKQGYTHHACSLCGDRFKSDYVDASGHCYEAQVVAPTRTARGYTLYICNVCHDSYKADYVAATGTSAADSTENTAAAATEHTDSEMTEPVPTETAATPEAEEFTAASPETNSAATESTSVEPTNSDTDQTNHTGSAEENVQQEAITESPVGTETRDTAWYNAPFCYLRGGSRENLPLLSGGWTRAQVVSMLWRSCGSPVPAGGLCPYADIRSDADYYDAVLWAWELGIARGIDADRFAPEAAPARRHVVSMLYWVFGEP